MRSDERSVKVEWCGNGWVWEMRRNYDVRQGVCKAEEPLKLALFVPGPVTSRQFMVTVQEVKDSDDA